MIPRNSLGPMLIGTLVAASTACTLPLLVATEPRVMAREAHHEIAENCHRQRSQLEYWTVEVTIDEPDDEIDADGLATIALTTDAWCDLFIDGLAYGRARNGEQLPVRPGEHEVVCTQALPGGEWRATLSLGRGEHRALDATLLRPVRVAIRVGGDELRIDGQLRPDGATLHMRPGRHTIEVMAVGERIARDWVAIPRVTSCTLRRDHLGLACFP